MPYAVHRTDEIKDSDIGTGAGLFEVVKIGDEYFTFIVDCAEPKACTVLLRGASKDILNEVRVVTVYVIKCILALIQM